MPALATARGRPARPAKEAFPERALSPIRVSALPPLEKASGHRCTRMAGPMRSVERVARPCLGRQSDPALRTIATRYATPIAYSGPKICLLYRASHSGR